MFRKRAVNCRNNFQRSIAVTEETVRTLYQQEETAGAWPEGVECAFIAAAAAGVEEGPQ